MLRSYTTVIRDSFRAAFKSKVLTFALGLILLILLALAPFHLRESQDSTLSYREHVVNPDRLVKRLVEEGKTGKRSAVAHVWNMLSEELQADLEKEASQESDDGDRSDKNGPPQRNDTVRDLIKELDVLLSGGSFYDEKAFDGKRMPDEAKALVDQGDARSAESDRRLNRLLLSTALRRDILPPKATQLNFYYFTWHLDFMETGTSHATFASVITSQLPVIFDKFVMSIGIFIALLVTASIIPEMLEPGSLNLLLSKPIYRWALLVAKYLGGCVFILLCAGLFFFGIWLWMGIQLKIWESSILLSIPVYVLVFAMYYSVSVLAGIWFRSPILSITFAILFWAVCSLIGWGYGWLDNQHYNSAAREVVATKDSAMMTNIFQKTKRWDEGTDGWKNVSLGRQASEEEQVIEAFVTFFGRLDEFGDLPGPAYNSETNEILIAESAPQPEGRLANSIQAGVAKGARNWESEGIVRLPNGTRQVFYSKRFNWIAIDQTGQVFQLDMSGTKDETTDGETDGNDGQGEASEDEKKSGLAKMLENVKVPSLTGGHKPLSNAGLVDVTAPSHASLNPANEEIAVYSQGELVVLAPNAEGRYEQKAATAIGNHSNNRMTAFVQYRGSHIFVALGNSHFYMISATDLSILDEQTIHEREAIRTFAASPSGNYAAAVLRSGQLWIYDGGNKQVYSDRGIIRQDVLAATFDDEDRLWTGTRFRAAQRYDLKSGEQMISLQPKAGWTTNAYRYFIRPLYRVFPKPGEFYKVVSHLSSSGDAKDNPDIDLTKLPQRDDPWSPLTSGLTFTALMLLISCLVFQRQDF